MLKVQNVRQLPNFLLISEFCLYIVYGNKFSLFSVAKFLFNKFFICCIKQHFITDILYVNGDISQKSIRLLNMIPPYILTFLTSSFLSFLELFQIDKLLFLLKVPHNVFPYLFSLNINLYVA